MSDFFTKEEIKEVKVALDAISNIGIDIDYGSKDEQRNAFFDKAKLWRVIEQIVSVLYIDRLVEGKMFLHNKNGDEYLVVKR